MKKATVETKEQNPSPIKKKASVRVDDERLEKLIHQSLDSYTLDIWNGQEQPTKKSLREGLTSISYDMRGLKLDVKDVKKDIQSIKKTIDEHTDLLSGIEQRKKLTNAIGDGFNYLKKNSLIVKILLTLVSFAGLASMLTFLLNIGAFNCIAKSFNWIVNLF